MLILYAFLESNSVCGASIRSFGLRSRLFRGRVADADDAVLQDDALLAYQELLQVANTWEFGIHRRQRRQACFSIGCSQRCCFGSSESPVEPDGGSVRCVAMPRSPRLLCKRFARNSPNLKLRPQANCPYRCVLKRLLGGECEKILLCMRTHSRRVPVTTHLDFHSKDRASARTVA